MKKKGDTPLNDEQLSQLLHAKLELESILTEIEETQEINQDHSIPLDIESETSRLTDVENRFEELCELLV